jgi:hypothetical protein
VWGVLGGDVEGRCEVADGHRAYLSGLGAQFVPSTAGAVPGRCPAGGGRRSVTP